MRHYVVFICALFVFEGEALMCIRCDSKDPHGLCRRGNGKHHTKHYTQSCYGKNYGKNPVKPKCYTAALMSENGEPYFERGCTLENDICGYEYDDAYLEYCQTCTSSYCNNDEVMLEQEVEEYLGEQGEHNESIRSKANVSSNVIGYEGYEGNDGEKLQVLTSTNTDDDSATEAIMAAQLITTDTAIGWEDVITAIGEGVGTSETDDVVMSGNTTGSIEDFTNVVEDSTTS